MGYVVVMEQWATNGSNFIGNLIPKLGLSTNRYDFRKTNNFAPVYAIAEAQRGAGPGFQYPALSDRALQLTGLESYIVLPQDIGSALHECSELQRLGLPVKWDSCRVGFRW